MKTRFVFMAVITLLVVFVPLHSEGSDAVSANYVLDWHTTDGNGGGDAASTNFTVNMTVGQVGNGETQGTTSDAKIGFWYGVKSEIPLFSDGFETGDVSAWSSAIP